MCILGKVEKRDYIFNLVDFLRVANQLMSYYNYKSQIGITHHYSMLKVQASLAGNSYFGKNRFANF